MNSEMGYLLSTFWESNHSKFQLVSPLRPFKTNASFAGFLFPHSLDQCSAFVLCFSLHNNLPARANKLFSSFSSRFHSIILIHCAQISLLKVPKLLFWGCHSNLGVSLYSAYWGSPLASTLFKKLLKCSKS